MNGRGWLRKASPRPRAGLTPEMRRRLREAHRTVVMLRGNAVLFESGGRRSWRGPCDCCGKKRWLQCAHLLSVGAHPRMRYDPDNGRPLCVRCHLFGWHKDPTFANDYIARRGLASIMHTLRMRERVARRSDPELSLLGLRLEVAEKTTGRLDV